MHHVLEVLFPYIILLYICDCITYVKTNQVLLTSWFGKKFDIKNPGFRLTGLLPTGQTILSHTPAYYCTPDGIYAVSDKAGFNRGLVQTEDLNFIKFDDLTLIEIEGKNIRLNRRLTINTPSSASARFHVETINKIKKSNHSKRKENIKVSLRDAFDLAAVKKIETSHLKSFSRLKFLSSHLFVMVFLVLPTVLYSNLYKYVNITALVMCIFIIYLLLLVITFVTVRKRYNFDKDHKIYTLLSIILSPVNAMHILGYLTKNLYFRFDFLALAAYFLPPNAFKELVRKEILLIDRLEHKMDRQDWLVVGQLKKELIHGLLDTCDLSMAEIFFPPEKKDQTAISYCPYCLTEYQDGRHNCIDCEMELKQFGNQKKGMWVGSEG